MEYRPSNFDLGAAASSSKTTTHNHPYSCVVGDFVPIGVELIEQLIDFLALGG